MVAAFTWYYINIWMHLMFHLLYPGIIVNICSYVLQHVTSSWAVYWQ